MLSCTIFTYTIVVVIIYLNLREVFVVYFLPGGFRDTRCEGLYA